MRHLEQKLACLALVAASGIIGMAAPASAAAGPNTGGTNCHGVVLSYFSTSDMAPGQLHKDYEASVRDVQAQADALCA